MSYRCRACGSSAEKYRSSCWTCLAQKPLIPDAVFRRERSDDPDDDEEIDRLSEIDATDVPRMTTALPSLNRALGGGLALPSVVQLGGKPGAGKSTLLLQVADMLCGQYPVLYVSSEQKKQAIAQMAKRLRLRNAAEIRVVCTTSPAKLKEKAIATGAKLVIADSLQGLRPDDPNVKFTQLVVRDTALDLISFALKKDPYEHRKGSPFTLILLGHITKQDDLAGLKEIQHMVDVIAQFSGSGGKKRTLFLDKNRYGPTHEITVFTMEEDGLHEMLFKDSNPDDASQPMVAVPKAP